MEGPPVTPTGHTRLSEADADSPKTIGFRNSSGRSVEGRTFCCGQNHIFDTWGFFIWN
ncbi:hypothetical protein CALVIDRAFT_535572 [Calocera viscosa TUFC12733]|uniref:Uncharacterized protein n=1 Tax=Calocera viscosa (strain TUFC12733) TaxID=1330018 RepID=A0A167NR33_CALVF|nr:hypothetical protein CALVIDRAFT_535572 [Calocera viscosa TUFC12733]